jgi:hypothetical protein
MDENKKDIILEDGLETAVIIGNRFNKKIQIENNSKGDVQILGNVICNMPVKEEENAIIVDNDDSKPKFNKEGTWYSGEGLGSYRGRTSWADKGFGESAAFFTPELPEDGIYAVYVWYGDDPNDDHATDAKYKVKFADGEKVFKIDLKKKYKRWNLLGEFNFVKGSKGYVMIDNNANGNVLADAVKFIKISK